MLLRDPFVVRPAVSQLASAHPTSPDRAAAQAESERLGRRARLVTAHRTLEIATAASLVLTGALDVIAAVNRPSAFGDGRCASGDPVFGIYVCEPLPIVHGVSAAGLAGLYIIATVVREAVTPDPPWSQESPWWRSLRRVMTYGHIGDVFCGAVAMRSAASVEHTAATAKIVGTAATPPSAPATASASALPPPKTTVY